jgi:hypothetical protein
LVLPTYVFGEYLHFWGSYGEAIIDTYIFGEYLRFGEAIIKTSKIHNLLIQYPNNTYFSALVQHPLDSPEIQKLFLSF